MDLKALNTFMHVAELGSFSRAGERLGYSQPTVSVQIRQLEQDLGARLLDRVGHTVRLTEEGKRALVYAQQICHMCQQMRSESREQEMPAARIRVATADSLCAPLVRQEFTGLRRRYPQLSIHLTTAGTKELFRMLDQNEADLVCTLDSHIYSTNYVIASEEKVGVHFVVGTGHPLAGKGIITRQELLAQDLLLTEKGMSYRRLLDEWLAKDNLELQPVLETGRADLLCELVEQEVGMSFLPDYVTEEAVARGTVVRLEVADFQPELWKQLLYRRDKWISRPMEAVIRHLTNGGEL